MFWSHSRVLNPKDYFSSIFSLLTLTLASLLVGDEDCECFEHPFELISVFLVTPQPVASSTLQSDKLMASMTRPSMTNMEPWSSSVELPCSPLSGAM